MNNRNCCILYDRDKNFAFIPEGLNLFSLIQKFANPGFYTAFKSAVMHAQPEPLTCKIIDESDNTNNCEVEGFAVIIYEDNTKFAFSKNTDFADAAAFQKALFKIADKNNLFENRNNLSGYVLELLYDYMQNPVITYDELKTIYDTLDVTAYTEIPNEQLTLFLKQKKQKKSNVTFLSEEEYNKAIAAAEEEFSKIGLGFFGGIEDEEENPEEKQIFADEKEKLIYTGGLVVTFSRQKNFDDFLNVCREDHIVGAFSTPEKAWRYKKYFYFEPTDGNLKLCAANSLDGIMHDGIVDGAIFSR